MEWFVRPQDMVEPQHIEGDFKGWWTAEPLAAGAAK